MEIYNLQKSSEDRTPLLQVVSSDQVLREGVKSYRINLAHTAIDSEAALSRLDDISSSQKVEVNDHEKIFEIDDFKISVKTHPKPELHQDVRSLLKKYVPNIHAWFDVNMEFSMNVG